MTNILDLPLIATDVVTATNEDWRDSWAFQVAASALAFPSATNIGNGAFTSILVDKAAPIGELTLAILAIAPVTAFGLTDDTGTAIGKGVIGVPFSQSGLSFTLNPGVVPFAISDQFTLVVFGQATDLTGITFAIAVKKTADDSNILLSATSDDGNDYLVADAPHGVIGTAFPQTLMQRLVAGDYGYDVVAKDAGANVRRQVVTGALTIIGGYSTT